MKIPDKIYLREFKGAGLAQVWSAIKPTEKTIVASHEYICKDALLEKLKKAAALYKKRSDEGELVWQNMCGIKEAIDLLNSM